MAEQELYDRDFFEWTKCNAALLRAGRFEQADIAHIAEEIEDMGKRERRELESRLEILLQHLLKWQFQQERRSKNWTRTIKLQRLELAKLLREMPSLKSALAKNLAEIYGGAVVRASDEADIPEFEFPSRCPFALDQILDQEFLPE